MLGICYACGRDGTLALDRTSDGGRTRQNGRLCATVDGGLHWQQVAALTAAIRGAQGRRTDERMQGRMKAIARRPRAVAVIAAATALLVSGCGAKAPLPDHSAKPQAAHETAAPRDIPQGPPHPAASGTLQITLPVRRLPTSLAVAPVGLQIPASVTVAIPAAWQGAVGAYWSGFSFLGPAGWTGKGLFGADGSGGVTLYPPGGSAHAGPRLTFTTAGACMCGAGSAAAFFTDVRRHWSSFRVVDQPPPPPAQVVSQVMLSPNLVAYRLPNTKGGLDVNGVAYSGLVDRASALPFEQMNTYLPKSDHALATVILDDFIGHDLPQAARDKVDVFAQSALATMYAALYFREVGPIFPPANVRAEVTRYAPRVSAAMLRHVPAGERSLDAELIRNIETGLRSPQMALVPELPGFRLQHAQLPSGSRTYWYPSHGRWPRWVDPTVR